MGKAKGSMYDRTLNNLQNAPVQGGRRRGVLTELVLG
jgi:hypothetical protein